MDFTCAECEAICRELTDLVEISHRSKPGPGAAPEQLAAWFDERDADEEGKMRRGLALATVRNRLMEHRRFTGHNIPLPLQPGGFISPN